MNQLFGQHPGLRSMHAKGVVVEGSFTPNGAGAAANKASSQDWVTPRPTRPGRGRRTANWSTSAGSS